MSTGGVLQAGGEEAVYLQHGHELQLASILTRAASCSLPGDLTPSQVWGVPTCVTSIHQRRCYYYLNTAPNNIVFP